MKSLDVANHIIDKYANDTAITNLKLNAANTGATPTITGSKPARR